jgi:tetratricopeptide (TPR) repeat protein
VRRTIVPGVLAALALSTQVAAARPHDPPTTDDGDFWRDIIEPHATQVASLVTRARRAMTKAAASSPEADGYFAQRAKCLDDAYSMLRYARTLAPENPDVLHWLGIVADELGKTREALDALTASVKATGVDRATADVTGRLGMIYLRLGQLDDAVRWLNHAQGVITTGDHAVPAIHLATALAERGEMADAIDVLINALPPQITYYTDPQLQVSLALAVHYDRDEQRAAAFAVLDRMRITLQQELGSIGQRALANLPFAPAEDQYYYLAMLYEATGDDIEARAEWALYAAVPDAPWRRRALDHIQAIDAQRRTPPGKLAGAVTPPRSVP